MPAEGLHIRIRMRDPRQECGCTGKDGVRPVACTHFDGRVVCLWQVKLEIGEYTTACGPALEPHLEPDGALSCNGNFKMFRGSDGVALAEQDYDDRRAELLRLEEPAHA